jgi:NAD(P) transhydrogenase subunit beta
MWLAEGELTPFRMAIVAGEVILGCLTCTGGLMAAGKLAEWITTRPVTYAGQNIVSFLLLGTATVLGIALTFDPTQSWMFPIIIALALIFGVLLILPIGGADMPTVISFLNSYAGLSAVAMGFVLENKLLIAAGALDGASGFVLSIIMCKAMNRSVTNVLFGAFGSVQTAARVAEQRTVKSATPTDAAELLAAAESIASATSTTSCPSVAST